MSQDTTNSHETKTGKRGDLRQKYRESEREYENLLLRLKVNKENRRLIKCIYYDG